MWSVKRETKKPFSCLNIYAPVPVAARSKARSVFHLSNTGIGGSDPARGMDMC